MVEKNMISALNWAIEKDDALHQVLKGLAGKTLRVVAPAGIQFDWFVEADGLLSGIGVSAGQRAFGSAAANAQGPDVTVSIGLSGKIRVEGDAMVAEKLGPLLSLMKSRFSPIERFWNDSPAGLLAKQVADYAVYESNALVSRPQLQAHHQALRKFRDDLDRLEKRMDHLERSRSL